MCNSELWIPFYSKAQLMVAVIHAAPKFATTRFALPFCFRMHVRNMSVYMTALCTEVCANLSVPLLNYEETSSRVKVVKFIAYIICQFPTLHWVYVMFALSEIFKPKWLQHSINGNILDVSCILLYIEICIKLYWLSQRFQRYYIIQSSVGFNNIWLHCLSLYERL